MGQTIINVSNRLPVTVTEEKISKSSGGLVAALEGMGESRYTLKWLGWPGADIAILGLLVVYTIVALAYVQLLQRRRALAPQVTA